VFELFPNPQTLKPSNPQTRNMQLQSKYRSKIYRDFRAIEPAEWRAVVRFYERNEKEIRELDFDEFFEMMAAYTNALFEIGAYEKHLLMADAVIEASVMNNIKFFNGEDIFHKTLFKKAAACFHTWQLEKADYILRELLRMDPRDEYSALFLKKCLRKMRPTLVRYSRAAGMLCFLLSAVIICFEMLIVRSFYPVYTDIFEASRNAVFFTGLAAMGGGDLLHRWRTNREVDRFVRMLRRRRKV